MSETSCEPIFVPLKRTVVDSPVQIATTMRRIAPFLWQFSWNVSQNHFAISENRLHDAIEEIETKSHDTLKVVLSNTRYGRIIIDDSKRYTRTHVRRHLTGGGVVESSCWDDSSCAKIFGPENAERVLLNLIYGACLENPLSTAAVLVLAKAS